MKVSGSPSYRSASSTTSKNKLKVTSDALEQKLVSNVPGEDKVWKYPPLSILNETEAGKAERGDIKGNYCFGKRFGASFGCSDWNNKNRSANSG